MEALRFRSGSRFRSSGPAFVAALALFVASSTGQEAEELRTWADVTGAFRVEARLVHVDPQKVTLEKPDGARVDVPVERLSSEDRAFALGRIGSPAASPAAQGAALTAATIVARAERERTAVDAAALLEKFVANPHVPETEKAPARERLEYWRAAAKEGMRRVGSDWKTQAEAEEAFAKQRELFATARHLYDAGDKQTSLEKAKLADRVYPDRVEPIFWFGILAALAERDADTAHDLFTRVTKRRIDHVDSLSGAERANLAFAFNNRAVAALRMDRTGEAMQSFREAVALGIASPELAQNLGRLLYLSSPGERARRGPIASIELSDRERDQLIDLLAAMGEENPELRFSPSTGWLYMLPVVEGPPAEIPIPEATAGDGGDPRDLDYSGMIPVSSGSGFVVAPNYVLTNRHVVEDERAFHIRWDVRKYPARVVATSDRFDLALLHCPDLPAEPIAFATKAPKLGEELRLLGYPLGFDLGSALKSTRGSVTALPPHDFPDGVDEFDEYLMYDGTINPGNSGGPACNARGEIVAVNSAILFPDAAGGGYAVGVPYDGAVEFLRNSLPDYEPAAPPALPSGAGAEAAVAAVGPSVVQVLALRAKNDVIEAGRSGSSRFSLEDPWCMACDGRSLLKCPNPKCAGGSVQGSATRTQVLPNGQRFSIPNRVRVECPTCDGDGGVDCPYCSRGRDPSL